MDLPNNWLKEYWTQYQKVNILFFITIINYLFFLLEGLVYLNETELKKYTWCWLSMAEYLTARLLESTIPDAQTQSSQNQLRESAITHIGLSAEVRKIHNKATLLLTINISMLLIL